MSLDLTNEFPLADGLIYLNHAAVGVWPKCTAEAVKQFADENATRGAADYPKWLKVEAQLRENLRKLINARSTGEIALVKNTSEALSFVAYGLDWKRGDNIVTSNQEFPSNRIVWESLADKGVTLRMADLAEGETPEDALIACCDENTRLLTISSVQYASGLRMDLQRLGDFCKENHIQFCIDAIQSIGALQCDVQAIHADFVMADGHKWMLGPEGIALFYCRHEVMDKLQISQYGWHMVKDVGDYTKQNWEVAATARRFECGSPNMLGIHALNSSIGLLNEIGMNKVEQQVLANAAYLIERIHGEASLQLISADQPGRYGGIVTFRHLDKDSQSLHESLMRQSIICAYRGGGIRFSPHFYTPVDLLDKALDLVTK